MDRKLMCGRAEPVHVVNEIEINSEWAIRFLQDAAPNDNDKSFAVPASKTWHVLNVWVEYTSDGTAGTRQIVVEIANSTGNIIAQIRAGATQAASLTRYYQFSPSMADLTSFRDTDFLMTPFPPTIIITTGMTVRVYDNNNVSGNDDMGLRVLVGEK